MCRNPVTASFFNSTLSITDGCDFFGRRFPVVFLQLTFFSLRNQTDGIDILIYCQLQCIVEGGGFLVKPMEAVVDESGSMKTAVVATPVGFLEHFVVHKLNHP